MPYPSDAVALAGSVRGFLFVDPSYQTRRETSAGSISRTFLAFALVLMAGSVIFSWLFVRGGAETTAFAVMVLWMLCLVTAASAILISRIAAPGFGSAAIAAGSLIVIVLGLITAFLSGDKFDTVRAGLIFLIMMGLSFQRQRARV